MSPSPSPTRLAAGDGVVVVGLDGVEADPRAEAPVVHDLTGSPDGAGRHDVARAHLPSADADLLGEAVDHALHRELRLIGAEAAERAADRVVGAHGDGLDVDGRHRVRTGRVAGGPFEHLHADRRVRPRVAEHPRPHGRELPVGVAAGRVLHPDRMALRVHQQRFLARRACTSPVAATARRRARCGPGSPCPPCHRTRRRSRPARPSPGRGRRRAPTRSGCGRPTRPDHPSRRADRRRRSGRQASTPVRGRRARCAGSGTSR